MRVLTALGYGELVVDEAPEPAIGPGQVLVQTKVTAVSGGTERYMLYGRPGDIRDHGPPFPAVGGFGYLGAGDVIAVGAEVDHVSPGDRVSCGRNWGAHRELLDTDAASVIRIPEDMSYLEGAASYWAVPPLAGILAAAPRFYADTAVIGLGPLGLSAVQILTRSSRRVLAIDIVASRVAAADSYGAIGIDGSAVDAATASRDALPGGPEVVIEASGTQAGLELAFDIVRPLGRVALVGHPPPLDGFDLFWPMQIKGIKLVPLHRETTTSPQGGGAGSPRATYLPDVIDMISRGILDIAGMMTWVVPVERDPDRVLGIGFAWEPDQVRNLDRFNALAAGPPDTGKSKA
jgi:threonine dehydrogenase-like Zn-dependent dehydrogenase